MVFNALRRNFLNPLKELLNDSRAIGVILLLCTFLSLIIANLAFGSSYVDFWNAEAHIFETLHLPHSLLHWINDGLMAFFFFLVGMEIKREMVEGELSSIRQSILPIFGAFGGMAAPALIFLLFTKGSEFQGGWGIPTATDIAFSLGIASLLGKKVPVGLKIFLTALAIIDDLGAIVVIALFYGGSINGLALLACAVIAVIIYFVNGKLRRFGLIQIVLGVALWYFMFNSGVHATVAGVVFAFLIPTRMLTILENKLHHPVHFFVMPLFALANTAIIIPSGGLSVINAPMPYGVMFGLFLGKPIGILLGAWLLVKAKVADLPAKTNWYKMAGAGILAGIGFTMSIFIATLAFADKEHQDIAKISVLITSAVAMLVGFLWLYFAKTPTEQE